MGKGEVKRILYTLIFVLLKVNQRGMRYYFDILKYLTERFKKRPA